VRLPDGLHWNLLALFAEATEGLARAAEAARLDSVGIDSWGVDYGLLDSGGRLLGIPFHYRDPRTQGMVERAHSRVPREEMYAVTGIQTMPINTVFQLLADEGSPALAAAERIALVPDLFAFWLTGELANEATAASTTGLLDARTGIWARDLISRLGLPAAPFARDVVEPGTTLGAVSDDHEGPAGVQVRAVAGHDTASAFAATPVTGPTAAILSSGTWSLLGLELDEPLLDARACRFNLTNERGVDGTVRLLSNVMGLWLLQECRRQWEAAGEPLDYDELQALAAGAPSDVPLFDPDDAAFLTHGDMPARIREACRAAGQAAPETRGEVVRSVVVSLACKYRFVLERLQHAAARDVDVLHVIGGGARNDLLCQLTADVTGIPVLAGPVEATALGSVLIQAHAEGGLVSLADMRAVAGSSARPAEYEPRRDAAGAETYARFLATTGLVVDDEAAAMSEMTT
jgi:rhamnulokinase